jgi:beta-N-acetylhexosaminidase
MLPQALAPVIFGAKGLELDRDERAFFADAKPFGFIVFARNIESREQIRALVADMRRCVGYEAPVLIDQEGGRVARLRGNLAHNLPPMAHLGKLFATDPAQAAIAAYDIGRLLAFDLARYDIWVDCVPVLDVPQDGSDDVIGDRALGRSPDQVAILGKALAEGAMAGGCLPIIKHIPGHGRAGVDSHHALPKVDAPLSDLRAWDFAPFRALNHLPMAMTAHVLYSAIDPDQPATLSKTILDEVIRGDIGFDGLVITDDLSMGALGGTMDARARHALDAGCDVLLHCNGKMDEMLSIMQAAPRFSDKGRMRAAAALAARTTPDPCDLAMLMARLNAALPGLVH